MKHIFYLLTLLLLTSCGNRQQQGSVFTKSDPTKTDTTTVDKEERLQIQFTDQQLENYLDSIGSLSTHLLADEVSFIADSTFKNQLQMDKVISESDFSTLKEVIKHEEEIDREIDIETAKNIFGVIQIDSFYLETGKIPITLLSFDQNKNDLNEYAICLGNPNAEWSCKLYFFKGNRIIAQHIIEHHYGLELKHYKDSDGKTVVYYEENFGTGSGIWQFNFYFYKYYNNKLIPILNELESGNLQSPWGARIYWLEAFVTKTTPLTLKMVYYQELYDTTGIGHRIIDDSTFVQYAWNEKSKTLVGNYEKTKINKPQTLTYFLADNELLFINTYYKTLKACLKDKRKRQITLNYLNVVKNHYENN